MFDEWLRAYKDRLLAGVAGRLGRVSPNQVTVLAFLVGAGAVAAIAGGRRPLALVLWLLNRLLDGLDGTLARLHGRSSDFGAYLDILLDFAVYAAVPVALVLAAPAPGATLAALVLMASFYLNAASWMYLSALLERRGEHVGATRVVMPAGLVGGTETIVLYSAAILLPRQLGAICWLMAGLVFAGVIQRLLWARRRL
ncbi:MAG: CDP-alcohol phosphatidyltransferase family protein [Gemmatimonadales bacterium]|nr:CDP-alcohol phosphatidyltransferase family protein [Gemmatimonadales bacterium]MBA3554054.1 CDP-alcohol phosphatidyltransferase family protein [Gemmatimonadales bacterium]